MRSRRLLFRSQTDAVHPLTPRHPAPMLLLCLWRHMPLMAVLIAVHEVPGLASACNATCQQYIV